MSVAPQPSTNGHHAPQSPAQNPAQPPAAQAAPQPPQQPIPYAPPPPPQSTAPAVPSMMDQWAASQGGQQPQYTPPAAPAQYPAAPQPQYGAPQYPQPAAPYAPPQFTPPPAMPTFTAAAQQPPVVPPAPAPAPGTWPAAQPGFAPAAPATPAPQQYGQQPQYPQAPAAPQPRMYSQEELDAEAERLAWRNEQIRRQQQPPQQPQPPAQPQKPGPWDSLEYDESLKAHARWDAEAQRFVPKDQYSSYAAVERLNEINEERQRRVLALTTRNPVEVWEEAGGVDKVREAAAEVVREYFGAMQRQQIETSFVDQHQDAIYQPDGQGGYAVDQEGRRVLSDYGRTAVQLLSELEHSGVTDVRAQIAWLNRIAPPPQPQAAVPQQQLPPQYPQPFAPQGQFAPQQFAPAQPFAPQPQPQTLNFAPPTFAQQAAPPSYYQPQPQPYAPPQYAPAGYPQPQYQPPQYGVPQPSPQQRFLQRAEAQFAQQPGSLYPNTGAQQVADPTNPNFAPQPLFSLDSKPLMRAAIAANLIPQNAL